mgnify:CR=1 FL=1
MNRILTALVFAVTLQPAFAQETPENMIVLPGREAPKPSMEGCKLALERGNIIKTDETGALHIPFEGYYFVIKVDETELVCRMYRHVFGG